MPLTISVIQEDKNINNRGYSTIEAVIIIPLILSIIMLLFFLGIFFYNKNVLSHAASRAAIDGGQKAYLENTEIADYVTDRVRNFITDKMILLDDADVSVSVSMTEISVNVTGTMNIPGFIIFGNIYENIFWEIDITEYAARLKSPMFVRTVNRIDNSL